MRVCSEQFGRRCGRHAADTRFVSLDRLTVFELAPPDPALTASLAGFAHAGIRLDPAAPGEDQHPMIGDTPMRCETPARVHATGTRVLVDTIHVDRSGGTADDIAAEPPAAGTSGAGSP